MSALGFLTMAARMGMRDANLALRDVKRQRAALREIREYAGIYTDKAIRDIATRGLRRASTLKRRERSTDNE
jgi:hypothetical protein